jgi:ABC-type uncharacterized transport system substrate-binding protein
MKRRTFIAGIGSAATWTTVARAQQPAVPVIGWLESRSPETEREGLPAFIPVVFVTAADPVIVGLAASLNRPGANLTGVANLGTELAPKQLQLLRDLIPNATLFGVLADPAFPTTKSFVTDLQAAARTLGLQLIVEYARTDSEVHAFAAFSHQRVRAVLVTNSNFDGALTEHSQRWRAASAACDLPIP